MYLTTFPAFEIWTELLFLLPIWMYAELHYRLPFFKGLLYKKQPEIIFDIPHRVETEYLPLLLLIKDAHLFPIQIRKVLITLKDHNNGKTLDHFSLSENLGLYQKWFSKTYPLQISSYQGQLLQIQCDLDIQLNGKSLRITNDNYPQLSGRDFKVFIDPVPLPAGQNWLWGDLHTHSSWTEDQVEFGVPAESIPPLATAMGLSFCALTDHSYDLDDQLDSWTRTDPQLTRWKESRSQIGRLNHSNDDFLIIPGEELSVDNGRGENIHLAILNNEQFFPGSGDGLERGFRQLSEFHYARVLDQLPDNTLAFAAHPFEQPKFSHHLLIKRGTWNSWDYHHRLSGYQIINGHLKNGFHEGKHIWISQLLKGYRQYIYAGNDAHGSFNRFREMNIPLLRLQESQRQIFGHFRTGVLMKNSASVKNLIYNLKKGSVIVSNGPFIDLSLESLSNKSYPIGSQMPQKPKSIQLSAQSSPYFGKLKKIVIYLGDFKQSQESIFRSLSVSQKGHHFILELPADSLPDQGYIRAELYTHRDRFAFTNPIWFTNQSSKD